jgi:formylglycine-generating enzyme required for sulfatase activity
MVVDTALSALRSWAAAALLLAHGPAPAQDMVSVPPGRLAMGSDTGEPAEGPVHEVFVAAFEIDRLEATNESFAAFVEATGHVTDAERSGEAWHWESDWRRVAGASWRQPRGPGSDLRDLGDHPVVQVSWHDAEAYCHWRGKRLPTEAEWERAARGDDGRTYAWGSERPRSAEGYRASYGTDECCAPDAADGYRYTAPVGSFDAGRGPFGTLDQTGNVWEWVLDVFDPLFYARTPGENPVNLDPGPERVIRGGGWGNNPCGLRATLRHANSPRFGLSMVGIRCAR